MNLSEIVKAWPKDQNGWSIAPANLPWIEPESKISVGENVKMWERCSIGNGCLIGNEVVIYDDCKIGYCCQIGEASIIGSGCKIEGYSKINLGCDIGDNCVIQNHVYLGNNTRIGKHSEIAFHTHLGDGSRFGPSSTGHQDLGFTDGYRKGLAFVNGEPYIGAGCRWFTLSEAFEHWGNHEEDRRATMAQLRFAQELIGLRK